jgi:acyl dehydratase
MTAVTATHLATLDELRPLVGKTLGTSDWFPVDQARIDLFADATDDRQWIHIDSERAAKESPFGGTTAHGYLTLSLVVPMWEQIFTIDSVKTVVNYGLNKVRFTSPVHAGCRVRLRASLREFVAFDAGAQITFSALIELEDGDRPAVAAEAVFRLYENA